MKISKKAFLGIVLIGLSFNILAQVGIGTSNPHVSAALEIQSTSKGFLFPRMTEVARDAISNIATGLTIYCTDCGTSGEGVLQVYNASNWEDLNDFVSASTGGMFTEKVGIGTIGTTPIYALDVDAKDKGSSTYSARFTNSAPENDLYNIVLFTQGESGTAEGYLGTGGSNVTNPAFKNNFVVGTKNNTPLVLNTNDTERMRIDASGNVGICVVPKSWAASTNALQVGVYASLSRNNALGSGDLSYNSYISTAVSDAWKYNISNAASRIHQRDGVMKFLVAPSGTADTAISWNTAMMIDNSGNVLVGTTSNIGGAILNVEHPTDCIGLNLGPSASGQRYFMYFTYNGTNVGSIKGDTSATYYNTSSDYRLKENIADADDAGSKIDAIQVRKYDWKVDGSHQDYGMIAQELQAVAPVAVSGDADSEEMMGVDYSKLVPMLIKEIQSLRSRVAQLEN